jgi:hypothetical protein
VPGFEALADRGVHASPGERVRIGKTLGGQSFRGVDDRNLTGALWCPIPAGSPSGSYRPTLGPGMGRHDYYMHQTPAVRQPRGWSRWPRRPWCPPPSHRRCTDARTPRRRSACYAAHILAARAHWPPVVAGNHTTHLSVFALQSSRIKPLLLWYGTGWRDVEGVSTKIPHHSLSGKRICDNRRGKEDARPRRVAASRACWTSSSLERQQRRPPVTLRTVTGTFSWRAMRRI